MSFFDVSAKKEEYLLVTSDYVQVCYLCSIHLPRRLSKSRNWRRFLKCKFIQDDSYE